MNIFKRCPQSHNTLKHSHISVLTAGYRRESTRSTFVGWSGTFRSDQRI